MIAQELQGAIPDDDLQAPLPDRAGLDEREFLHRAAERRSLHRAIQRRAERSDDSVVAYRRTAQRMNDALREYHGVLLFGYTGIDIVV